MDELLPEHSPDPSTRLASENERFEQGRFDVFHRLLRDRIVFLGTSVDDEVANFVIAQMLFLEAQDPDKPIWLYVNSPGGSVTSGMAIYDTMQFVGPEVGTICMGLGASMGQFLLCAGAPGKRYALPHARILMHQPLGGVRGDSGRADGVHQADPPGAHR